MPGQTKDFSNAYVYTSCTYLQVGGIVKSDNAIKKTA